MNRELLNRIPERFLRLISTLVGAILCGLLALVASLLFPHRVATPLLFIAVAFGIAWFFGSGAGILGALVSALVFAYFSSPFGSLRMVSPMARANLEWLLLIGIPASYLFIPHKDGWFISRKGK
jgi:K+-sensing histidine kinase KdpD